MEPPGRSSLIEEHSYVPSMWQKISNPDILIFLNASFAISTERRKLNWQPQDHEEQLHRLEHARQHANIVIDTDDLTPEQVLHEAVNYLKRAAAQLTAAKELDP
jgi:hypothetical protein